MRVPRVLLAGAAGLALVLSACTTDAPEDAADGNGAELTPEEEWFDQEEFDRQLAQRDIEPEGSEDEPWLQAIEPEWVDTSEW